MSSNPGSTKDTKEESEIRHRASKKGKDDQEEEISYDEKDVKKETEKEEKTQVDAEEDKPKTRKRSKQPQEEEPLFTSKKVEYTVAILRALAIIVVFTVLHSWVTRYILDPYMGRSSQGPQFRCPEGLDCEKIMAHIENVRLKE